MKDKTGKLCDTCGVIRRCSDYDDQRAKTCRFCMVRQKEMIEVQEVDARIKRLDEQSLRLLEELIDRPVGSVRSPHLANVLEDVIQVWGGSEGYARHIFAQYLAAKPGSPTRMRCLELLERFIKAASTEGFIERPLSSMTDDEVEKLFNERREMLLKDFKTVDAVTTVGNDAT